MLILAPRFAGIISSTAPEKMADEPNRQPPEGSCRAPRLSCNLIVAEALMPNALARLKTKSLVA